MIAKCPHCHFAYTIMPEHIGLTSVCQNCNQNFVITEDAPYAPPKPQAAQDFAGPAAQYDPPPSGKLSRTMAKAQAKAQAKADAEAKAKAKADAKAQAKGAGGAAGGKSKLPAVLLVLVILGAGAFFQLVHQPTVAKVKALTDEGASQAVKLKGLNTQLAKLKQDQGQVEELKAQHDNLQKDIAYYSSEMAKYRGASIYYQLAASVVAETRYRDILLLERINALESGAKIEIQVAQTQPNPELAQILEGQMEPLSKFIAENESKLDPNDQSLSGATDRATLANDRLTMATLRRNYYIAKYGLNAPYKMDAGIDTNQPPLSQVPAQQ